MVGRCKIRNANGKNEEWEVLKCSIYPLGIRCAIRKGKVVRLVSLAEVIKGGGLGEQVERSLESGRGEVAG